MKKNLMILATAALMLAALPAHASAKERGCDYRLRGLTEAELALDHAQKRGSGIAEARAQLDRARATAFAEGCFVEARKNSRIEKVRWDDRERGPRWEERREARRRFDYLIAAGYRRGLSRQEFTQLEQLRERFRF